MSAWTPAANAALLSHLKNEDWPKFSAMFPEISYNAWESKRRRVQKDLENEPEAMPIEAAGDEYIGPSICYFDFETTYSSLPRLLSAAGVDGFGKLTVFDQRNYGGREDWLNDRAMAVAVRDYLESFHIIASWNGKRFDIPVLNGRLAIHGERPINPQMHIDLMYYAGGSFMRVGSKALDNISKVFDSPNRKTPLSVDIWDRADHGSEADMDLIVEHNVADVYVTRDVARVLLRMVRNIHRGG